MQKIKPKRLESGDTIGIIAPANTMQNLDKRLKKIGVNTLEEKGFKVVFGKHVDKLYGHTAGRIEQRLEDFTDMFENPNIDAVMTVWGGYNCHQLLPYIDYNVIKKNPKIFIGFSDITALNNGLYVKAGLVNFSGPAFVTFCQPNPFDYTQKCFDEILIKGKNNLELIPSKQWANDKWYKKKNMFAKRELRRNPGWNVLRSGKAEGIIVGGNLSTLNLLIGTEFMPDLKGKILFIEDDADEGSTLVWDRQMTQLRQIGVFDEIEGLVIGRPEIGCGFTKKDSLEMIVKEATKDYDFPIISEVDFGHTDPMITIPIGIKCRMDTKKKEIEYLESAVL